MGAVGLAVAALQGFQGRALDDGDLVSRELIGGEELAQFQLDELDQFGVVDHVDLVEIDDHGRHADLTGEEDVLAGLGHGSVVRADDEDGPVHLCGTRDHVLNIVGVARAVYVGIVAFVRLVLDVGRRNRDAPFFFLGGLIYLIEGNPLGLPVVRQASRDR